jgi:SpoVK/Ycf46/Vps4 family AAA+-type ATPase
MNVTITKEMAEAIGPKSLKKFGIDEERYRWNSTSLNLRRLSNNQVKEFQEILDPHHRANVKGARVAMRDIKTWIDAAAKGVEKATCKDVKQFESLAFEFLQKQPGHRLYKKDDERDVWQAFFVNDIQYHPPQSDRSGGHTPPYTSTKLHYMELGSPEDETENFYNADVRGKTVPEILTAEGYIVETDDLRANYLAEVERYEAIHDKIGRQFWADGIGTTNLDGNSDGDGFRSWGFDTINLERDGQKSRVVIDVFRENDNTREEKSERVNVDFWRAKSMLEEDEDADPDEVTPENSEVDAPTVHPEIPLLPIVPVFDLRRHTRMRVHVSNLTDYVYDKALGDKLVLPDDSRDLVDLLLSAQSDFRDIIRGKGGGAVILCAGPPGVGKTLTAEVYAEVMERPLYSVQCSQLGTDEEALERELLRAFSRSARWNAILLLDEADVYVAARGTDIQQNAIVGVFLRVLEYYTGVLFLTTNRAESVDDAIASRCIARLEYQLPTQSEQAKIWKILSDVAGVEMEPKAIAQIVIRYPKLSGRDVKQLLKLAGLVARARGETQVTAETIEFVKRFKPSSGDGKAPTAPAKVSP